MRPASGVHAAGQRVALAALTLALLAPIAAVPANTPARRRAGDISTGAERNFYYLGLEDHYYYVVQPLTNCANVTRAAAPAGVAPACCTATPLDCAKRCDASPECTAFRYAFYADTPPAVADAPLGALPAGGTWQACDLLSSVEPATCATQLEPTSGVRPYILWAALARSGSVQFDFYWRTMYPPVTDAWLSLTVNVSGPDAAALLSNNTWQRSFATAVAQAAQVVCCATLTNVQAVQSAEPNAAGQSAVVVTLQLQAISGRFTNTYVAAQVAYLLARAEGEAALLAALLSRGFANPLTLAISANGTPPPARTALRQQLMPSAHVGGYAAAVVVGIAAGLGGALIAMLVAAALLLRRYELVPRASGKHQPGHDVFLSYRRVDLAVTDAVHDKLVLAGLRVFYDRGGFLAGKPFATAVFAAIRDAPVVCVVVTLDMVRGWAAHTGEEVDYVLVELLIAMHFARHGRVRLLYPLLVGEWRELAAAAGGGERDYLPANSTYLRLCEAMPAVAPTATLALVASLFAAAGEGESLDAMLAAATVRELILGGGDKLVGVLQMTGCALSGPEEQAGLVLRHRYAERILVALAPQPRAQPPHT